MSQTRRGVSPPSRTFRIAASGIHGPSAGVQRSRKAGRTASGAPAMRATGVIAETVIRECGGRSAATLATAPCDGIGATVVTTGGSAIDTGIQYVVALALRVGAITPNSSAAS